MAAISSDPLKSKISPSALLALVLLAVSAYQLTPEAFRWGRQTWREATCRLNPPHGHLKPLGEQRPPLGPVEVLNEWPEPDVFYREYVAKSKPVVFKGLGKSIPAFQKWTDEYIMKKFGHEEVAVENGLKQKDYRENLYLTVISEFLRGYKQKEIYLVDTMSPARFADVHVPKSIVCGNFLRGLSDVIMWLSNGGTKSIIHRDYVDNINCVLDGTKTMHLLDKRYTDIHDEEYRRSDQVDVDKVDLCSFPSYVDLPRHEIIVQPGDCLFIPFQWYHQVNANKERNLGINFWFQHISWFNESDCIGKDTDSILPFGAEDMPNSLQLKKYELLTYAGDMRSMNLTQFIAHFNFEGITDKQRLTNMFNEIDSDEDGVVTLQEMYGMDSERFNSFFDNFGGLRFLDYTRERSNLDPENDTSNDEL